MYKISTLNKISPIGLKRFTDKYEIVDGGENVSGATGILVRSQVMHEMDFDDELLAIARAGAGVNNIPLEKCADQGIVVFNTPGANANSVKELVLGSMIVAARNIDSSIAWVNSLKNDPSIEDMAKAVEKGKSMFAGSEILGKTLGVVGLGAIGAMVANSAVDLGMKVYGYDPFLSPEAAKRLNPAIQVVGTTEEMYPHCEYVTLHLPATKDTTGMINAAALSHFKDGAILLNFSRDKLVEEADILAALDSGKLSKYVTDFATNGILGNDKVTVTPHLGASTEEAEDNCAIMAADEMMDYVERGNIVNSVNFPRVTLDSDAKHRVAILTKGESDPAALAQSLPGVSIKAISSGVRGEYGYALVATDDDIAELPAGDAITKARIVF